MRQYINQIDDKIIKMIFSQDELSEYKEITKKYIEAKNKKQDAETTIMKKLKGAVIGELEGVDLQYLAHGDTFYIAYKDQSYKMSLWGRVKFIFTGRLEIK
jgi:hypothetical protein